MVRIILAPSWELAQKAEAEVTIEAEYGSNVWEGSLFTAAHHQKEGPYSPENSPAPCNNWRIPYLTRGVVGVSHFDLDTLGGCLRAMGRMSEHPSFWELAEFVDLNGAHRVDDAGAEPEDVDALYAWWAWSSKNRAPYSRDSVIDITDYVLQAHDVLEKILAGAETYLSMGDVFRRQGEKLSAESFVDYAGGVVVRVGPTFASHLYRLPAFGEVAKSVVHYNTLTGAITVSLERETPDISCREIVQELWGPEAGGRDTIAGSPRQRRMGLNDLSDAVLAMETALAAAEYHS